MTEDPAGLQQVFPDLDTDDGMSPVVGQYAVQFSAAQHYIDINDFAFAEKIFASAPAGLYAKPYATSPLAVKSMMV